jgi:hypothetical protein
MYFGDEPGFAESEQATRWSLRLSLPQKFEGHMTNFVPRRTLKSVSQRRVDF